MKKMLTVVAMAVLVSLVGCEGEQVGESTTVVDSTAAPVTPEPMASDTEEPGPVAIEPATEDDATPVGEPAVTDADADGMTLPKNHTVDHDGVMHAPGAESAATRCAACHGKDLRGGKSGVSCHDCHDQNWS
ncbi:MAG TPA: hypothetical protein VM534_02145 [Thermoanaerobaculia bacterium]|nr:hypothetical protein [Thermoanaerobaculia bacterium]